MAITQESVLAELRSPIALACHDAGATSLIIGWLRTRGDLAVRPVVGGPAESLWRQAFPQTAPVDIETALDGVDFLLSGTGWATGLEFDARHVAQARGIRTAAVVDHWVNYCERFLRDSQFELPDEIWVADDYAFAEAERCFPHTLLRQLPNLYLEGEVREILAANRATGGGNVLYVLEPIRRVWGGNDIRAGEFQALDYFIDNLSALELKTTVKIRLRPHPSDPPGKYDAWLQSMRGLDIGIAGGSLAQAIAEADWVVGCESFAMVVALHAGKRVVSVLPPWAPACRLPQSEIRHLKDLVNT